MARLIFQLAGVYSDFPAKFVANRILDWNWANREF